jgi:hypothetical protein
MERLKLTLEPVDLPKYGRCAFRGRQPENVRVFLNPSPTNGAVH